jgi:hypothetical protein
MPPIRRPALARTIRVLAVALAAVPSAATAVNYVPNPGFEDCIGEVPTAPPLARPWAPMCGESVGCDDTLPSGGAFSLRLTAIGTPGRAVSDCVLIPENTSIPTFRFAYRTAASAVVQVSLIAQEFTSTDCTGDNRSASAGAGLSFGTPLVADDGWHTVSSPAAPTRAGTQSVRFIAGFRTNAAVTATVRFDDLEFTNPLTTASSTTLTPGATTSTTVTTTRVTPTTQPVSYFGAGDPASECFVTFGGIASGKLECTDGDPACDRDGAADGACTFAVGLYVAQPLAGCQAGTVLAVKTKPASFALPVPLLPATGPACASQVQFRLLLRNGGRRPGGLKLIVSAKTDGQPKRERDGVRFRCLPPP